MECQKCRTHNNYYHNYCYYCGVELESNELTAMEGRAAQHFTGVLLNKRREMFNHYKARKQSRKKILFVAFIAAISVIGVVCWIIING